ncbi:MAG: glycoside hydrolase family 57 protein [Panacibacter sp.]
MPSVCLYFKVHHPFQLKQYNSKEIGVCHIYEDVTADTAAINALADACYLPANAIILSAIAKHQGKFKVNFSMSGVLISLLQKHRPDVIESFRSLTATGFVEIMAETYYHSLSYLHSKKEFDRQVEKHSQLVVEIFGVKPRIFRNTELIYNNSLASHVAGLGYAGILCEGIERLLKGRTHNKIYKAPGIDRFSLLLRNSVLSDDISFRFDDASWNEHPLTADKFAEWIHMHPSDTEVINLFMDYETFGIHKKPTTGIFDFLEVLPTEVLKDHHFDFVTASGVIEKYEASDEYDVPKTISWEDKTKECCVWCDNMMQNNTLKKIYSLEKMVTYANDEHLQEVWGRLQAADYFYYMANQDCTNNNHYYNPFETPGNAYKNYTNIITDFEISLIKKALEGKEFATYSSVGMLY